MSTKIEAVFKPARDDGGLAAWQLFQCKWENTAQLYSDAFGASQRSGAFVLRSSFQMIRLKSGFKFRKYFLISGIVAISGPERGPIVHSLLSLIQSDHRGARGPVDFSVPVAYHSILLLLYN